ncbi:MAG: MFS transporter [Acidobacteriota bacterium]
MNSKLQDWQAWKTVLWLWGAFFIAYITRQSIFSIFPVLRESLGFTEVQLGLTGTVFLWAYACGNPIGGYLSDRISKKKLIVTSILLWSLCMFMIGMTQSPAALLTWRGAMALAQSLYIVAAISLITQVHTEYNRSKALSLHGTAQFAGITFGGWYGGFVAEALDWRWMLWLAGVAGALYTPLLLYGLRDPGPTASQGTNPAADGAGHWLGVLRIPTYLSLCFNFIAINAMLWVIYAWLPDFLRHKFQLSLGSSGFTATVYVQSATIVGILTGASIADYLVRKTARGRAYVLLAGLAIACPFFFGVGHGSSLLVVKISALGYGFFKGAYIANFFATVMDIVPQQTRGFAVGFSNMLGSVSGGLAAFLVGLLKTRFSPETLFSFGTALGAVAALTLAVTLWTVFTVDYQRARLNPVDRN